MADPAGAESSAYCFFICQSKEKQRFSLHNVKTILADLQIQENLAQTISGMGREQEDHRSRGTIFRIDSAVVESGGNQILCLMLAGIHEIGRLPGEPYGLKLGPMSSDAMSVRFTATSSPSWAR